MSYDRSVIGALGTIGRRFIGAMGSRLSNGSSSRGIGPYSVSALRAHPGSVLSQSDRTTFRGNRWMPHHGAKERARHATWPDGPMHRTAEQANLSSPSWKRNPGRIVGDITNLFGTLAEAASSATEAGVSLREADTMELSAAQREALDQVPYEPEIVVGTMVEWQNGAKRGRVTHVVPAGKTPGELGVPNNGSSPRDSESYVVDVGGRSNWPNAKLTVVE